MKQILNLGKKRSKWILDGGLKEPKDVSQIDPKAFPLLAKMNERGYITFDSQSGETKVYKDKSNKTEKEVERAYVAGFMEKEFAKEFEQQFNLKTDFYCIAIIPTKDIFPYGYTPVTKVERGAQTKHVTRSPTYIDVKTIEVLVKQTKLPKQLTKNMVLVECIDMKWGRKAYQKNGLFTSIVEVLNSFFL